MNPNLLPAPHTRKKSCSETEYIDLKGTIRVCGYERVSQVLYKTGIGFVYILFEGLPKKLVHGFFVCFFAKRNYERAQSCTEIDMRKRIKRHYRIARYVLYRETILEPVDHVWTFIGTFIAIASIGWLQQADFTRQDGVFLIGSFGASCVLIFGATNSPLAQPRNLIGGHLLASVIGVAVHKIFPDHLWLASALAVSLTIVGMQISKTMHPPAGATALIANIGSEKIMNLGFYYTLTPVMSGVMILFCTALIVNNIPANRSYPVKPLSWATLYRKRIRSIVRWQSEKT